MSFVDSVRNKRRQICIYLYCTEEALSVFLVIQFFISPKHNIGLFFLIVDGKELSIIVILMRKAFKFDI